VPKKRHIPLLAKPKDVPRVKCNTSIPGLAAPFAVEANGTNEPPEPMVESGKGQLSNNVTKSMEADSTNKPPEPTIESDKGQLGTNVTKSLNPYRSDDDLGDLDWRFSVNNGRLAMDEEVCHLNT
jgi:hypothetical protein